MVRYYALCLLSFCVLVNTAWADQDKISCKYPKDFFDAFQTKHQSLQQAAKAVGPQLCMHLLLVDEYDKQAFESALKSYAELGKESVTHTFPNEQFPGSEKLASLWEKQLNNYEINFDYLNPIRFVYESKGPGQPSILRAKLPPDEIQQLRWTVTDQMNTECQSRSSSNDCLDASKSLLNAIRPAFSLVNRAILVRNGELISTMQKDWRKFIKDARYQTPLDVWFTTALQYDRFNGDYLVGPPRWQAFLLRPSIVYEHINELEKGGREDVSLAIEWAGINWWKAGFGVSLTSIYHDRKETDSIGHGLTFHIKNSYSIGYVHRDDDNGSFFFNIDLLEFFGEQKAVYRNYREYFGE